MIDDTGQFRVTQGHRPVAIPIQSRLAPLKLLASEIDDLLLVEGDIAVRRDYLRTGSVFEALGDVGRIVLASIGIVGAGFRWQGARVPFVIESGNSTSINAAIAHWHNLTSIRFEPRLQTDSDYVIFRGSVSGSDSEVGRRGNGQVINLKLTAGVPVIIHEIGHAIGLWHEHTRDDRDGFIAIDTTNIESGAEPNFAVHAIDGDKLGTTYDFDSIMHYPPDAFAKDPLKPVITALKGESFGQAVGLSATDISAVRTMYP